MPAQSTKPAFAVCVQNEGVAASLEIRKIYQIVKDEDAKSSGMIRVIDESGEDYLYPAKWFWPIQLPAEIRSALKMAS